MLIIICRMFQCLGRPSLLNNLGRGTFLTLLHRIFHLRTFIHHSPCRNKCYNHNNNNLNFLPHQLSLVPHNFLLSQYLTPIIKPSNLLTILDWSLIPLFLFIVLPHNSCRKFMFLYCRNFLCHCR